MTPEQYRRVESLFDLACDHPAGERPAVVRAAADAAGDGPEVVARVLAMLARDDSAAPTSVGPSPLAGQLAAIAQSFAPAPLPERIGRYRVVRLIGEGGMGRVFECEQDAPRRRVALKLLRPGMLRPSALRRFRNEAETLGRLSHPGIAAIHDAGTWDTGEGPQPYFAMEYVDGLPIDHWADRRDLGLEGRVRLMLDVCDAVGHAHAAGVIHRDLKPDNVLVDAGGRVRVLDFGIARTADEDADGTALRTETGQLLGTLQYMSPEQCGVRRDELDARCDVYALGVLAFELLCGRRPYEVGGIPLDEAVRVIREAPPARPGTINRVLRGDLETIVLKALEKEPDRRYPSVVELAADLRRHLADEPIRARPPSTAYQLRKLARRHRTAATALITVMAILVTATAISITFAVQASAARDAAERSEADARERVEELEVVNGFLDRMLEQADPWRSGGDVSVAAALDRARDLVAGTLDDRPALEARVRETIGRTLVALGRHAEGSASWSGRSRCTSGPTAPTTSAPSPLASPSVAGPTPKAATRTRWRSSSRWSRPPSPGRTGTPGRGRATPDRRRTTIRS